ncbi:MAG: DMT family transporter [Pseudomonadota bacterium]
MMTQKTLSSRSWIELLLLSAIWGGSFLSIRIALDEIGFVTSVAHRVGWAALLLWGVIFVRAIPVSRTPRIWLAFFGMGLLNNVIPFSLMAWGQLHIASGLTSILNAGTAVFGVLVAALFFADERLTARRLIGVLLGFAGVATAIGLGSFTDFDISSIAQLAVIAGTISYALAGVWARKMLTDMPPQLAAAGMLTCSALVMIPAALVLEGPIRFDLLPQTWTAIGYYAVIATAGAYLLYYRVLAQAGSGNLMLCTLLIVPFAITLGAVLRDEALPLNAFIGFAILALGLSVLDGRLWRWLFNKALPLVGRAR